MEASFWQDKWLKNEIGFHLDRVNPQIEIYHSQVFVPGSTVFIPLCGKSLDIAFLANQGYSIIGAELSEIAINDFFREQSLTPIVSQDEHFTIYNSDNITLYQGDFFNLTPRHLENCSQVYDRASLIALPEQLRREYTLHMAKMLPRVQSYLLVTLEYEQSTMKGPPFSVEESEINQLFEFASVKKLYARNILEKEPRFKAKGLTDLFEKVYQLTW